MAGVKTAGIISLGCSKNLVDSENILGILRNSGYRIVPDEKAEIVIINTCGFIKDAVEESHEVIREIIERKKKGECKKIIVAGCLPLRDHKELNQKFPEIDSIVGSYNIYELPEIIRNNKRIAISTQARVNGKKIMRFLTNTGPSSYIKISEGCSNNCTYCTIPLIKGSLKSRSMESILEETGVLVKSGVREINLISQDTAGYGSDRKEFGGLKELLNELEKIEDLKWIRILYCHPASINEDLIRTIRDSEKICKYIDLPLQHINDKILRKMGRRISRSYIEKLLTELREMIPDITIRTTFIVGFPGETERDFQELYDFVKDFEFERMGVFKYSREPGTPAAEFEEQISERVKQERYDALMSLQSEISLKKNQTLIGREMEMIVERIDGEKEIVLGRISSQAPEVDGNTILYNTGVQGGFIKVKIVDAEPYDLIAEVKEQ